jgi:hypothetical protein
MSNKPPSYENVSVEDIGRVIHLAEAQSSKEMKDTLCNVASLAARALDAALNPPPPEPVPMLLNCPDCGERHIDEDEFATKPHKDHSCQFCGRTWRPAVVPTVGVMFLPGYKNPNPPKRPPYR